MCGCVCVGGGGLTEVCKSNRVPRRRLSSAHAYLLRHRVRVAWTGVNIGVPNVVAEHLVDLAHMQPPATPHGLAPANADAAQDEDEDESENRADDPRQTGARAVAGLERVVPGGERSTEERTSIGSVLVLLVCCWCGSGGGGVWSTSLEGELINLSVSHGSDPSLLTCTNSNNRRYTSRRPGCTSCDKSGKSGRKSCGTIGSY